MLLRDSTAADERFTRRWAVAVVGGLTALAIALVGLSVQPREAAAGQEKVADAPKEKAPEPAKEKPAEKAKEKPAKPAPSGDQIRETIEKLKKDLGDDPTAIKQLEEMLKALRPDRPPLPGVGKNIPGPDFDDIGPGEEMQRMQEMMRQQYQEVMKQMRARGLQGGFAGVGGIGRFGAFPGGGRFGIRVERPADTLVAQLDLPNGQGLVCADVPAESVAGKAGLKPHDILLEVGGKAVPNDPAEFIKNLGEIKADAAVDVVLMRKGRKETIKGVKLPEPKAPVGFQGFGDPDAIAFPLNPPRAFPRAPANRNNIEVEATDGETVRVEQVNDAFTLFYSKDGVKLTVTGSKAEGAAVKPESFQVEANGKTVKAETVDKLPKEYQELANKALKSIK